MDRSRTATLVMALGALLLVAGDKAQAAPPTPTSDFELQSEQSIGDLSIAILVSKDPRRVYQNTHGLLRISRKKNKLFEMNGGSYSLFPIGEKLTPTSNEKFTTDLNKNGKQDLVVLEQTSGIGCCLNLHLIELGKSIKEVGKVDSGYATEPDIRANADAANFSIYTKDLTFGGWGTKDLSEPAFEIVLRITPNGLRLDWTQMKRAALAEQSFKQQAKQASDDLKKQPLSHVDRDLPRTLIEPILTLIYSGNAEQAHRFIDEAWPDSRPAKEAFRISLFRQLATSPYWQELKSEVPSAIRKRAPEESKHPIKR